MKLQLFVLCCVLQLIVGFKIGFNIDDSIQYPTTLTSSRIVGGEDAPEGLAPYQCSMQQNGEHYCGCVILSNKWVLTAAQCIRDRPSGIDILVGTVDLTKGGTRYKPNKSIMHEKFNQPRFANDIAVIEMKEEIEFNDNVQPIEMDKEEVEDGAELLVTGWGQIKNKGQYSTKLQMIKLSAVQTKRCRDIYDGEYYIHDSHICTFTKEGEGVCNGDAGGPLVLGNKIVGLVSFGVPCAKGSPDAYSKISYLHNWVSEKTGL